MENLGPCPLCGGEAERSEAFETWITCLNCGFKEWEHQWQKVATLAASERRMRSAIIAWVKHHDWAHEMWKREAVNAALFDIAKEMANEKDHRD